jgi:molybdopterin synthase sulfur carrier subunit
MSIHVKFFASLRERLGREAQEVEVRDGLTVGALWCVVSGTDALPANVLAALNQEYATPEQPVHDGDEVAFFPPVTGG